MAQRWYKPSWEELKQNGILTRFGSDYVLKGEYLLNYLSFLKENSIYYELPTYLQVNPQKQITQQEYESIQLLIREDLVFSFSPGEDDSSRRRRTLNSFTRK